MNDSSASFAPSPNLIAAQGSALRQRSGPWAVVTGASEGIGRAFGTRLSEKGGSLVVVVRREEALKNLASEFSRTHGIETLEIAADLGKSSGIDAVVARTESLDVGRVGAVRCPSARVRTPPSARSRHGTHHGRDDQAPCLSRRAIHDTAYHKRYFAETAERVPNLDNIHLLPIGGQIGFFPKG